MAAPETAGQPGAGWDEAQCTTALAHLERLQAQINDLRLAIPRVIEPLHRPANPTTFKLYAQGVLSSQNGVKQIHQDWKHQQTQDIFDHTRKSQAANRDFSASASVPEDYGWIEREQRERKTRKGGGNESTETTVSLTDEDIVRILGEFKKTYPNIPLETQDNNRILLIRFISGSIKLNFRISIEQETNGKPKLNAECLGTSEPFLAITRCIASRPQTSDLKYLLDMIAAYKTVKGISCATCGKLLDSAALTPTARRQKQTSGANDVIETAWKPFHESCLD